MPAPTRVICPVCGRWDELALEPYHSPRYQLPCQGCGAIFALGSDPDPVHVRYWHYYRAVHGHDSAMRRPRFCFPLRALT